MDLRSIQNALGRRNIDESLRVLCDFLYRHLHTCKQPELMEFEGKLGTLVVSDSGLRFGSSLRASECLVKNTEGNPKVHFNSFVTPEAFQKINELLNQRCVHFKRIASSNQTAPKMTYGRVVEVDKTILALEKKGKRKDYVRVTCSPDDENQWLRAIKKVKGENCHLNFSAPHSKFDFRISASYEKEVPMPPRNNHVKTIRKKDRVSYKMFGSQKEQQHLWQIDISYVENFPCDAKSKPIVSESKRTFEVEVEVNTKMLLEEKRKLDRKERNHRFQSFAKEFLVFLRTMSDICSKTRRRN